jgi:enoyl-CoA hydratase/carnithine racemase
VPLASRYGRATSQALAMALVDYAVKDQVATSTLNRPDARNAINSEVAVRLADAWAAAREHDDVRVVVVTGTGSSFCAGADLGQLIPMADSSAITGQQIA